MDYRVLILFLLGYNAFRIVSYLNARRRVKRRHEADPVGYEDISSENISPPPALIPLIEEVNKLGFKRLGEVQTTGAVYNPPLRAWFLIHSSRSAVCDLYLQVNPEKPPIGSIITFFKNGCVLTTFRASDPYMLREVNDSDFRARDIVESLSAVYQAHREDVATMRSRQGIPIELDNVADYLRWSQNYIKTYFPRRRTARKLNNSVAAMQAVILTDFILSTLLLAATLWVSRGAMLAGLVLTALLIPFVSPPLARYFLRQYRGNEYTEKLSRM